MRQELRTRNALPEGADSGRAASGASCRNPTLRCLTSGCSRRRAVASCARRGRTAVVRRIMSERDQIECHEHGAAFPTYVCRHLIEGTIRTGTGAKSARAINGRTRGALFVTRSSRLKASGTRRRSARRILAPTSSCSATTAMFGSVRAARSMSSSVGSWSPSKRASRGRRSTSGCSRLRRLRDRMLADRG